MRAIVSHADGLEQAAGRMQDFDADALKLVQGSSLWLYGSMRCICSHGAHTHIASPELMCLWPALTSDMHPKTTVSPYHNRQRSWTA